MPLMHAAAPQPRLELAARQMTCCNHSAGGFCQQPCLRPARRHRPSVRHLSLTKPTSAASLRRSSAVHGAESSQCCATQPGSAAHSVTPSVAHSAADKQPRISDPEPLWSDALGSAEHRTAVAMVAAAAAAVVLQAGAAWAGAAAPGPGSSTAAFTPGPVAIGWEVWVGAVAGIIPFAIGAYEFSKRILIQRRCGTCSGSGLVTRGRFQRKCPDCGGFFPWRGWAEFLSATASPGNGGPLRAPRGQTSVFYECGRCSEHCVNVFQLWHGLCIHACGRPAPRVPPARKEGSAPAVSDEEHGTEDEGETPQ